MTVRLICVACVLLASFSAAGEDMPREEAIVRNSYAKLAYAVDLNTVYRAALADSQISSSDLTNKVETQGLKFRLSDFVVGDLSSIAGLKYIAAFPQYPDGQDVIQVTVDKENLTEGQGDKRVTVSTDTAVAKWTNGPVGRAPDLTVAEMIPIMERESGTSRLLRYCTFTVTAVLSGRSRSYSAAFFFGPDGQVAPGDTVVGLGGGALWHFLHNPACPRVLLETSLWQSSAAVRAFVLASQKTKTWCRVGDACCDIATLQ